MSYVEKTLQFNTINEAKLLAVGCCTFAREKP